MLSSGRLKVYTVLIIIRMATWIDDGYHFKSTLVLCSLRAMFLRLVYLVAVIAEVLHMVSVALYSLPNIRVDGSLPAESQS